MPSVIERTIKGGAGFFAAKLVGKGFGFLFIVIASRFLGAAEFGILSLGLSVTGVARNFAVFGLPNTIQRFLSGQREIQKEKLYGAVLLVGGSTGLLCAVGLYVAAPWLSVYFFDEPGLVTILRILSVGVFAGVGWALLRGVLQAQEQVQKIVVLQSVRSIGKVAIVLFILIWVRTAAGAAWAIVGAFVLGTMIALRYVSRLDIQPSFELKKAQFRKVVGYSAPLVVVGFSYFLAQQADRLMLGWLANAEVVGLYTVTSTLAMVMSTLHGALVSIFMPIVSEAYRNDLKGEMREAYLFVSKWIGAVNGGALLVFTGGGLWILKLFGTEYSNLTTYHVLLILSGLYFIGTWVGPTGALLQMTDGHRLALVNALVFVVANILLNYYLIKGYGVKGAALATLLSGITRNTLQVCEINYLHGFNPFFTENMIVFLLVGIGTISGFVLGTEVAYLYSLLFLTIGLAYLVYSSTKEERGIVADIITPGR